MVRSTPLKSNISVNEIGNLVSCSNWVTLGINRKNEVFCLDLLKLHHVLRTRLPSLKSNHPTHPASPGFLNSLADVPLSPYLKDPSLGAGFFLATGETKPEIMFKF